MKKKLTKILASLCCLVMLFTTFTTVVSAHNLQLKTGTSNYRLNGQYVWTAIDSVVSTQQTAKYFVITAKAGTHTEELYISFPAEGGFRLQSKHEYQAELEVSNVGLFEPTSIATIDYKTDAAGAIMMSGTDGTILRYTEQGVGFELEIFNGSNKKIIFIKNKQISFAYNQKGKILRCMLQMPLQPEKESIYNGSQRYCDTNVVGDHFSLLNCDCWSAANHAYGNVPLFHSNRGYSIWFNMVYPGEANFGDEEDSKNKYTVKFDGDKLDFYLWTGTPLENLKKYTSITGTSGMSEEWTFGFWTGAMSKAFTGTYKKNAYANMLMLIEGYKEHYNFVPEAMYGEGTNSTSAMGLSYAKEQGFKMLRWYQPSASATAIMEALPNIERVPRKENGEFVSYGVPHMFSSLLLNYYNKYFLGNDSWIDYSNPTAADYTAQYFKQQWSWGLAGAMIDYGEYLPINATAFNGLSGSEMHNLNSYYYAKVMNEQWTKEFGNDYVLFERSATAGSQYFVGNFQGDQKSTYAGYAAALYDLISRGAGGFNLYGNDIGGLGGTPSNDLWNRWVSFSVFQPYMRQHGADIHLPWTDRSLNANKGFTAETMFGKYYYLRKNLVPSIMSAAMDANKTSNPIVKGMMMAYPYQIALGSVNNQYLFCDDFLVCCVMSTDQHTLKVSFPKGHTWYSLYTYEKVKGGQQIAVDAPTTFNPVYVQDGAVKAINLAPSMNLMDELHAEDDYGYAADGSTDEIASLLITPPDKARTSVIYTKVGASTDYRTYTSTTETYVSTPKENAVFTVTNDAGSQREIILALGVTAADVTVDGVKLTRLDHKPDYFFGEYGYYVDLSGLTTIYTEAGWKTLSVTKGNAGYTPYTLKGDLSGSNRMFDGDVTSYFQLPQSREVFTTLEIEGGPQEIGHMDIRWAVGFNHSYTVEYTEDGENWYTILPEGEDQYTVSDCVAGIDVIDFEPVMASKIRLVTGERGDTQKAAAIYEMSVYAPDDFVQINPDEEEELDDEDEEWDDEDWEEDDDDEWDDDDEETGKKKRKKKLIITDNTWIIFLIVGIAVVVVTAIVLIVVLLAKKKKKAAEAELNAVEESPTDFPNPPSEE